MGPYRRLKNDGLLGSGASEQAGALKKAKETPVDPAKAVTTGKPRPFTTTSKETVK